MAIPRPTVPPEVDVSEPADSREQAFRLLRAVSVEMAALSQDIVRLGEALSGEMVAIRQSGGMQDLQSFDLIAQSAQSHAQLLHELIDTMSHNGECEPSRLEALIQIIPFHGVRGRLSAAIKGLTMHGIEVAAPDNDADWF
jgi:hypothetical protein